MFSFVFKKKNINDIRMKKETLFLNQSYLKILNMKNVNRYLTAFCVLIYASGHSICQIKKLKKNYFLII